MSIFDRFRSGMGGRIPDDVSWERLVDVAHAMMCQGCSVEQIKARVGPVNAGRLQRSLWDTDTAAVADDAEESGLEEPMWISDMDTLGYVFTSEYDTDAFWKI